MKLLPAYDPGDNSRRCYGLAVKAWREQCIRRHQIKPDTPEEERWAKEGERRPSQLDAVRK